ncbi:hypothetical protein [Pseudoalteromonas aliena]|nr:hypothetical protein [Pseudoalteromonas aliena]
MTPILIVSADSGFNSEVNLEFMAQSGFDTRIHFASAPLTITHQ